MCTHYREVFNPIEIIKKMTTRRFKLENVHNFQTFLLIILDITVESGHNHTGHNDNSLIITQFLRTVRLFIYYIHTGHNDNPPIRAYVFGSLAMLLWPDSTVLLFFGQNITPWPYNRGNMIKFSCLFSCITVYQQYIYTNKNT